MRKEFLINEDVVKSVMENYSKCRNNKMLIKKEMFSNYDYINWLNEYTLMHTSFTDNEELDDNVKKLGLLYEVIADYAINEGIIAKEEDMSSFYRVVYNDSYFEIGNIYGLGSCFFCSRIPFNENYSYIDFNEVYIKFMMNEFGNRLCKLYRDGYSLNDIIREINNFSNDVKVLRK